MGERLGPTINIVLARNAVDFLLDRVTAEIVVNGRENIPEDIDQQGYVLASNHNGWVEALVWSRVFPVQIHWMTKEENFAYFPFNLLLNSFGFFPVKRGEVDINARRTAIRLLSEGKMVGMMPEGTRGRGEEVGKLKPAKRGTIGLAVQAGVEIIPVAVWGTEKIFPLLDEKGLTVGEIVNFKPPVIAVGIGPVFRQHLEVSGAGSKEIQRALTTNLMLEIKNMLPPEYHGHYAEVNRQELTAEEFAK